MKRPPILDTLRQETRNEHLLLEQHPLLQELLSEKLSLDHYCRILAVFHQFYQQFEGRLIFSLQHPATFGWPPYIAREPLLRQDLADFGKGPQKFELIDRPDFYGQESFGPAELIGVLYVLEGATQGGRVISPALQRSLGLTADHGARYFNLHDRHDSWARFCRWLHELDPATLPDSNSDISAASARSVFIDLYALLVLEGQTSQ